MAFLTRHEKSIKARLWLAFLALDITFHIFFYNLWLSLNIFLNFFFFFFLCQKLSEFSGFQTLFFHRKQKCVISFHSLLPLSKQICQGLTVWILFVSLLSFPKERRTNRLNSFVSPFSLFKEFKTTQFENSFDSSLSLKQKISKD